MAFTQQPMDIATQWNENEIQLIIGWITSGQQIVYLCTELKQKTEAS
jgi:hypothetical protein